MIHLNRAFWTQTVYLHSSSTVSSSSTSLGAMMQRFWLHSSTSVSSLSSASLSSGKAKKSTTSSRNTRLAGRLRFYKQVGVISVSPPWEGELSSSIGSSLESKNNKNKEKVVGSPISAGVDGTNSASGVSYLSSSTSYKDNDKDSMNQVACMLLPRKPGTVTTSTNNKHADPTKLNTDVCWFGITLDDRTLKTPMGQKLAVPSERLAYAIAAEWDAQTKRLQPTNMPLMTLACTALDQVAYHPRIYQKQALNFLPTDTTCFWADPTEDRVLHRRQEQAWNELHKFVEERLDHAPAFAMGASEGMLMARKRGDKKPSAGLPHPPNLLQKATEWTESLDAWHLVALSSMCAQAKSFLVAWAVMEPESPLREIAKAMEASRVEEEFQISNWGLVEGGHDYDRLNCSIQLHSSHLFAKTIAMDNQLYDY